MPRLEAALLADNAQDYGGKVSILGGFVSMLNVPGIPFAYVVQFVGRVSFSREDLEVPHHVQVSVTDDGANAIFTANLELPPAPGVQDGVFVEKGQNLLVPLLLNIEAPGIYVVVLEVDGEELAQLPLQVAVRAVPGP